MMARMLMPKPRTEKIVDGLLTSMPPKSGMTVSMHGPGRVGHAGDVQVVAGQRDDLVAEDRQHRRRVDVRQPVRAVGPVGTSRTLSSVGAVRAVDTGGTLSTSCTSRTGLTLGTGRTLGTLRTSGPAGPTSP